VTKDPARVRRVVGAVRELGEANDGRTTYLHVLTNRPDVTRGDSFAVAAGALVVTLNDVRLGPTSADRIVLYGTGRPGSAVIENGASEARTVAVQIGARPAASSMLAPGARWRVEVP